MKAMDEYNLAIKCSGDTFSYLGRGELYYAAKSIISQMLISTGPESQSQKFEWINGLGQNASYKRL